MLESPLYKENTMFVYVWKDYTGVPFYVGMGQNVRRPSPKSIGHRNKICALKVQELGADNVVIELHTVPDVTAAKVLEQSLIARYGRLVDGSGTLTNISAGGEFHETTSATKARLKALWANETHRSKTIEAKTGKTRALQESTKELLRKNLTANPSMRGWGERNGKDAEFDAKRIEGIRAAQPKRAEKMTDPVALAQRKERLKATLNSPEYKAKRSMWDTPEYRARLSENKKAYWAKRKLASPSGQ
jgi:hypothetical protein